MPTMIVKLKDEGRHPLREMALMMVIMMATMGTVSTFNLDPNLAQVFPDPRLSNDSNSRSSYFGFSVSLEHRQEDDSSWLFVGAPRANSSQAGAEEVKEPGVLYKCNITSDDDCHELTFIQEPGNDVPQSFGEYIVPDKKDHGWLGASLDTQPTYAEERQATAVCAPRWHVIDNKNEDASRMTGICYVLKSSLPGEWADRKFPLYDSRKQEYLLGDKTIMYYACGQAGMSVHFPDNSTEMILGAPGIFDWQGAVIQFKDKITASGGTQRRRRQTKGIFDSRIIPSPNRTNDPLIDNALMGFAVTSGKFRSGNELMYASGAPKGANSLGKVIIFSFPSNDDGDIKIIKQWEGEQFGEYFGAAVVAADVNGDGLSDLIVGSPMYSFSDGPDVGRISAFLSTEEGMPVPSPVKPLGSNTTYARFGTTLTSVGDLNYDKYEDVAVGAPWEGDGAVYIYMGSADGLKPSYSQRLVPKQIDTGLAGFGMALSRGIDVDGNYYNDLAIGSFLSGHAVVIKSRPVASVKGFIESTPSTIALNDTRLRISACISYDGFKVPETISIKGNITLDYGFPAPRAKFVDINSVFRELNQNVAASNTNCTSFDVELEEDKLDARQPIQMKIEYEIAQPEIKDVTIAESSTQPITDPAASTSTISRVSIKTGCEDDGNDTCVIDMEVKTNFLLSESTRFVIGSDELKMRVEVSNLGEPVFLPNFTLRVNPPLALFLPTSHDCSFNKSDENDNRTELVCLLANPIEQNENDTVDIELDVRQLTDESPHDMTVDIVVVGEGVEIQPSNNNKSLALYLESEAHLKLQGVSKDDVAYYQRTNEDKINTTNPLMFHHHYSIFKSGPTPLGKVELIVDIPVYFTENLDSRRSFVQIYHPSSSSTNQLTCTISEADFAVERKSNKRNTDDVDHQLKENGTFIQEGYSEYLEYENETGRYQTDNSILTEGVFDCAHEQISCAQVRCPINQWTSDDHIVVITFKLQVDLKVLADHMSAQDGASIVTNGTAAIRTLNPAIPFKGNKEASATFKTDLKPYRPPQGVPWWVVLLAIIGGFLLLALLTYGLYKVGFFARQELPKSHQGQVVSSQDHAGCENLGVVGD